MREFIDKNELDFDTVTTDDYSGNEILDIVLKEDIDDAHVFTEQEIVKPYLDRLINEIQKLRNCSCTNSDGVIDEIEDMIDKILSEQEKEK